MLQDHENFADVDAEFEAGLVQAPTLWRRFGAKPHFRGKDVLEIGSALGGLSAEMALEGARSVVGVDIWEPRVEYSTRKVAARFPELSNIRFTATPSDKMDGENQFDLVISQNTFEHISDIDAVLGSIRRLLRPGGYAYLGFSPLYHSPFGDHSELRFPVKLPWVHLFAGRKAVIASFNKANGAAATTLPECGYNGHKPADFRAAFKRSGLELQRLRINPTEGGLKQVAMAGFTTLAGIPGLEPYFTVGMYAILRK